MCQLPPPLLSLSPLLFRFIPTVRLVLLVQAVVNEDTTADALLLQKENERLRKELGIFRQLQQVPLLLLDAQFRFTTATLL